MPGFDGTGPRGDGPMTGGARGYCNPASTGFGPAYGLGRGFRRGLGPGYGWRRGYGRGFGRQGAYNPPIRGDVSPYDPYYGRPYAMSRKDEISTLKDQAGLLNEELNAINKRIEDLESRSSE